ncbi:MAG: type II toxin-antitoxin system HicB family antitoxin, partial [Thermoanaerobaculia bacterium]
PGCVATGKTKEEVEINMHKAIEMHLKGLKEEGLAIPKSKSFAEFIVVKEIT